MCLPSPNLEAWVLAKYSDSLYNTNEYKLGYKDVWLVMGKSKLSIDIPVYNVFTTNKPEYNYNGYYIYNRQYIQLLLIRIQL